MKLMDRYIARQFVLNTVALFVLLFGFVVTVDVFVNLRRFIRAAEQRLGGEGLDHGSIEVAVATAVNVFDLWWPRLLQLSGYTTGVVLIAAMGFTCVQLSRHREFVALLASGVSLHRVAVPFVAVAVVFTGLQAANQEVVLPRVAELLTRDAGDAGFAARSRFPVRLMPDGEGRFISARVYADDERRMTDVAVFVRGADGRIGRVITAEEAVWREGLRGGRGGWELVGGEVVEGAGGDGEAVRRGMVEVLETPVDPGRVRVHHMAGMAQSLSWGELGEIIGAPGIDASEAERLNRVRWGRPAAMVSNVLTLVAALSFFLVRTPQPMLKPVLKSLPVGVAGLVAAAAASSVVLPGIAAPVAAMVPSLVLAPVAVGLFSMMKT